LNHDGYQTELVTITDAGTSDSAVGRSLEFPKDGIVAVDRGYNNYTWYKRLTEKDYSL